MKNFSPAYSTVSKITGLKTSHANAQNLISAHEFASIGHDDGRNYVANEYPSVFTYEIMGLWSGENHVTATSGDVLSHQGVTYDGTSWYTADSAALYKWSAIGATPTADGTNPSNLTPFTALQTETGLSGFDHIGDLDYVEIGGTGYLLCANIDDPDSNPAGIALYGTDLAYVAGSYSDFSAGYQRFPVTHQPISYTWLNIMLHLQR